MKEMAMRRVGHALTPIDPMSDEELMLLSTDKDVLVTAWVPRNVKQHRLAWGLAGKIAEAVDNIHDADDAMDWLKIKCRHVKYLTDPRTGQVQIIPKSIAFASLTQQAFGRLLNRMVYVTCTEIIPGLDEGALRRELLKMVGGGTWEKITGGSQNRHRKGQERPEAELATEGQTEPQRAPATTYRSRRRLERSA